MNEIVQYLRVNSSPEHPISGKDMANHFGITGVKVRRYINEARRDGVPVCSTRWGYYYSEEKEHIERTLASLRGRIISQENAITGLEKLLLHGNS